MSMDGNLNQVFGVLSQRFEEERSALEKEREELQKDRSALNAEKASMTKAGITEEDILELNVGGKVFSTKRSTLLTAPEDSVLHAMFSGRWDQSCSRDSHGRIFLDFTPEPFSCILSYLRTVRLTPPEETVPCPVIGKEHEPEFRSMMKFLGLDRIFLVNFNLAMLARDRETNVVKSESSVLVTKVCGASSGHAAIVGEEALPQDGTVCWKVIVRSVREWLGLGIVGGSSPSHESYNYNHSSSYMWASSEQVYTAGKSQTGSGWCGWQAGDVAVFKLDAKAGTLMMHNIRSNRTFKLRVPVDKAWWRLHVNLYSSNDEVEITTADANDLRLVA